MNAPRFLVEPEAVRGERVSLEGEQARQIATVLRLSAGDPVVLVTGGDELDVRLEAVHRDRIDGVVLARRRCTTEPRLQLTLAVPLLRGDRTEEVVEAVTQLGVSRIVPFTSERSVVRGLSEAKRERLQRVAREAAETARRGRAPQIAPAVEWGRLFEVLGPPVVVAWEQERVRPLATAVGTSFRSVSLVIGPEGGLTEAEIAHARSSGAAVVTLGRRNLRSETAAVAAVAQVFVLVEGST